MWLTFWSRIETISCRLLSMCVFDPFSEFGEWVDTHCTYIYISKTILRNVTLNVREQEDWKSINKPLILILIWQETQCYGSQNLILFPLDCCASAPAHHIFFGFHFKQQFIEWHFYDWILLYCDTVFAYNSSFWTENFLMKIIRKQSRRKYTHHFIPMCDEGHEMHLLFLFSCSCSCACVFLCSIDLSMRTRPFFYHSLSVACLLARFACPYSLYHHKWTFTLLFPSISIAFDLFANVLWHVSFLFFCHSNKMSMTLTLLTNNICTLHTHTRAHTAISSGLSFTFTYFYL